MEQPQLAVIGGTGLYDIAELTDIEELSVQTPYGPTSDVMRAGALSGTRIVFLARHGKGHRLLPQEVPYRANIWALKSLGVSRIISVSACGSLQEAYQPGHIVIPDQIFDRTRSRSGTFFGDGLVAHISFAEPFCPRLSAQLSQATREAGAVVHDGGISVTIDGPRFSSRAESMLFRKWGIDIIGMTTCPEAQLAREAEMCYAVMAHVTDYDCWHEAEDTVSVELVLRTLRQNANLARAALVRLITSLAAEPAGASCSCSTALSHALLTPIELASAETRQRLQPIIGKYMSA
jgi:5'-methylthioadenosine phosphorylase